MSENQSDFPTIQRVSVIGLGKLGLCTAACFAGAGFEVWGYDANAEVMQELASRRLPIRETDLEKLMPEAWPNLRLAASTEQAVNNAQVIFIIVPTPSGPDGRFDNSFIEKVLAEIGPALKQNYDYKVVDVISTVMPGSSESSFLPLLENLSGKKCGQGFGLAYNPEFIALGSVIQNFLNPDLVLIGCSDQVSGHMVSQVYERTCRSNPKIACMSLINAEISKLSLNCFVTMKISFANELSALCSAIPGADIDTITDALGADTRIGNKYISGGLGFGGPCFPRDNLAFQKSANEFQKKLSISTSVVAANNSVVDELSDIIKQKVAPGERVAILGLSYKPQTHIVERSQSIDIANRLSELGYDVAVHDPMALDEAAKVLTPDMDFCPDPMDCFKKASAVILATNWPEFTKLDWERAADLSRERPLLLDCWRAMRSSPPRGFSYQAWGIGPAADCSQD